jgi:capsule synthesis protein PGA_cap
MAERWRALIRAVPVRSLLPAALLLVPALAVWSILVGTVTGADRPSTAVADQRAGAPGTGGHRGAGTITIGWVGDITPGSSYGLPDAGGAALFAGVRDTLRAPDLMAGNLEGTLSTGGASKCGAGAANCYAFQAPPANARALGDAGFDVVNLANNHAFDYGGRRRSAP